MVEDVFQAFIREYEIQKCLGFCENETNLKAIQSIMGHANISTTMDIYAEATNNNGIDLLKQFHFIVYTQWIRYK